MSTSHERPDHDLAQSAGSQPGERPQIERTVELDADPLTVWEALATDAGRERWLEPDPDRVLIVESEQPPHRIAWWWWSGREAPAHVEVRVHAVAGGSRVTVVEVGPSYFPVASMCATLEARMVCA